MNIKDYIMEKLPYYYKANDTYKDSNDQGVLERFLSVLGVEIQEELVDPLKLFINQLDPTTATNQYLSLLASTVGNPTDILGDEDSYRVRLAQAITLYKNKGTFKSYKVLFALLGYTVNPIEHVPPAMVYDIGLLHDDGVGFDTDRCQLGCIEYSLEYSNIPGRTSGPLSINQMELLMEVIRKDLEPINARIRNINFI